MICSSCIERDSTKGSGLENNFTILQNIQWTDLLEFVLEATEIKFFLFSPGYSEVWYTETSRTSIWERSVTDYV